MKNPVVHSRLRLEEPAGSATEYVAQHCGLNTGNLLFASAVRKVVLGSEDPSEVDFRIKPAHDGIVIPAANWIQGSKDFSDLANRIEKADLPTVVMGLGAQSVDGKIPQLKPGTIRFLKAVSDRCHSISVRGAFTAEVLEHYGVKNVDVTGCPSLLWHVNKPAQLAPIGSEISKVAISTSRSDNMPVKSKRYILSQALSNTAYTNGYDYVAQTELSEISIAAGEVRDAKMMQERLQSLCMAYGAESPSAMEAYLRNHLRYFLKVSDWVEYASRVDFTFGTRLHGTIAALLAGRPALLVTHDTRTKEMAEKAGIPAIPEQSIAKKIPPIDELLQRVDREHFNRRQNGYYEHFRTFLENNKVPHNLSRSQIAA